MYQIDFETRHAYASSDRGIEVTVELHYLDSSVRLPAKIDTGAAVCCFQRAYADELGIQVEAGRRESFATATGSFVAYGHEIEINCLGHRNFALVYFAADIDFSRNVLGRQGWLDHHRMGLIDYESLLYLSSS
jgi:hypothetical protein